MVPALGYEVAPNWKRIQADAGGRSTYREYAGWRRKTPDPAVGVNR